MNEVVCNFQRLPILLSDFIVIDLNLKFSLDLFRARKQQIIVDFSILPQKLTNLSSIVNQKSRFNVSKSFLIAFDVFNDLQSV